MDAGQGLMASLDYPDLKKVGKMGFLSVLHIVFAVIVILLVLIQDSKGGGMGGAFGGGTSSNSLLGPTGATSFLAKLTRYVVIGFAITSIILTNLTSKKGTSALDQVKPPADAAGTVPSNPVAPQNPAAPTEAPKQ